MVQNEVYAGTAVVDGTSDKRLPEICTSSVSCSTPGPDNEARLFKKFGAMMSFAPLQAGPLALVSGNHEHCLEAMALARAVGSDVLVFRNLAPALESILSRRSCWSMLLIDIDSQDIDEAVSQLSSFRLEFPWQCVVLASHGFRDYDFSLERMPICDASLRIPFDFEFAEKAFLAAVENNRVWVERATRRQAPADIDPSIHFLSTSHSEGDKKSSQVPHRPVRVDSP